MVRPGGVYFRRLDLEGFQTVNTACLCYMLVVRLSELLYGVPVSSMVLGFGV